MTREAGHKPEHRDHKGAQDRQTTNDLTPQITPTRHHSLLHKHQSPNRLLTYQPRFLKPTLFSARPTRPTPAWSPTARLPRPRPHYQTYLPPHPIPLGYPLPPPLRLAHLAPPFQCLPRDSPPSTPPSPPSPQPTTPSVPPVRRPCAVPARLLPTRVAMTVLPQPFGPEACSVRSGGGSASGLGGKLGCQSGATPGLGVAGAQLGRPGPKVREPCRASSPSKTLATEWPVAKLSSAW